MASIQEEIFWKQKARIKWLKEGDSNTKFFHGIVRSKLSQAAISSLSDSQGNTIQGDEVIHIEAIEYMKELLSSETHYVDSEYIQLIPKCISEETNIMLLRPFEEDEIKMATFSIPQDSAAGMDDFSSALFISLWDIVAYSIIAARVHPAQKTSESFLSHSDCSHT